MSRPAPRARSPRARSRHALSRPARAAHTLPRFIAGATIAALAALGGLATATPAAASGSVAWSITPAAHDGADGRVSIRATLDPGTTITEHVELTNLSDRPLPLTLAGADGLVTPEGDFDVMADGSVSTRSGRWVQIQPDVVVEPRASVTVPFTVTVPADALPGDHPAGIVAAVAPQHADDGVAFIVRAGVRLHLRVTGDLDPTLTPTVTALEYEPSWNPFSPGLLHVSWQVANTGNVRLGGVQTLGVSDPVGVHSDDESVEVDRFRELLPDEERAGTFTVQAWPLFALTARLGAVPSIVGDDQVDVALSPAAADATVVAIPWVHLAVIVVLAGFVVLLIVRMRRRRASRIVHRPVSER